MITDSTLKGNSRHLWQPIVKRVEQLKTEISQEIAAKGLRASGRTQRSLQVLQENNAVVLYGREFFATLENGGAPWTGRTGRRCTAAQFRSIIAQWIKDKGLIVDDIKSASFLIARAIMQKGTLTHRNPRADIYTPAMVRAIDDIQNQINEFYTQEITDTILKLSKR